MDAILQKIKADIMSRPFVSVLILITIIASSALLTLALATLMNISVPYDKSFEHLNGAHLWLQFDRDRILRRDIKQIEALPGVVESTGVQYSVPVRIRIGDTRTQVSLRLMPAEMPAVNRLLIQEGRYLLPHEKEVLGSRELHDIYKLAVGDTIGVTRGDGKQIDLEVIGLAYNAMWDTYRSSELPYLYATEETLRSLYPDDTTWEWSLGLRLADPNAVDQIVAEIEGLLHKDALKEHTDWRNVRESAIFEAQLNSVFLGAFGLFAVLATILVIASSISSSVLSQFKQIGVLKAIGFTGGQILWLYMGQYFALGMIGAPIGLAIGIALSPLPLKSIAASLSTTFEPPIQAGFIALVLGIITGVVALATFGSARRGAQANIVKAIATGAESPQKKPFWGVRLAERLGLPMPLVMGINDVFVRPLRSFMTGLNLTLGVIGIIFGLTLNQTLETYRDNPYLLGIVYDAVVTSNTLGYRTTQHRLQNAPGVEALYSEVLVDAETLEGETFEVRAVEGDLAAFPFIITEGQLIQEDTYEALAGQGLLDWLGIEVGDQITLILDEKEARPTTWLIVGRYTETANAGQMLMVNQAVVRKLLPDVEPHTYYLRLKPDVDKAALKRYLEPRENADLSIAFTGEAIPSSVIYLQWAIFSLAGILIIIALVNVFNTSLMAMQEKVKTIGVLKTLGMTPGQVVIMANTTAGFMGLVALVLGIPLGFLLTRSILDILATTYGFGEVNVTINALYIVLLIPLMILISIAGSTIPGQQAARLSIVKVLRNE